MSEHRWLKFWPQDWQRDPALRSCTAAERGVWMDMLCIMHDGEPYGHLTMGGKPLTNKQIGSITGVGEKEAAKIIEALEYATVFSRTPDGVIYSRRMVRDHEASNAGREAIAKRWEKTREPNSPPNRDVGRGADSLEDRSKNTEARKKDTPLPPKGGGSDDPAFAAFWASYPRKDDKGHARKAWAKCSKATSPDTILAGLRSYQFNPDPRYIPLPATWLNGERWLHTGALPMNGAHRTQQPVEQPIKNGWIALHLREQRERESGIPPPIDDDPEETNPVLLFIKHEKERNSA